MTTEITTGAYKEPIDNEKAIIINQLIIRNIDRTMKDISTWRISHRAAESVTYPIRQRLYDLYDDVTLDGHLTGIIQKRFSAVLNHKLIFKNKAKEQVDIFDDLIMSERFQSMREEILKTMLWGITGFEFIVGKTFDWAEIPRKHIKPEFKVIGVEQSDITGFNYVDMPMIWVLGKTFDLGILLKCSPYAIWKRGGLADYAQFVEIFGQPVRIYEYDAFDNKTKQEVQKVADEAGGAMSILIPKQAGFRMEDGKTANANGDLQTKFVKTLNDEMSVIILGNTDTTTASKGSGFAQSKTHSEQQLEITKADMKYELQYLNSPKFLSILKTYGFPTQGSFEYVQVANIAVLVERIAIDEVLATIVPIDDDFFYDTYQIPKPKNYDAMKAVMVADKLAATTKPQPPKAAQVIPKPGTKPKPGDEQNDLSAPYEEDTELGMWNKIRTRLADFFDPAP